MWILQEGSSRSGSPTHLLHIHVSWGTRLEGSCLVPCDFSNFAMFLRLTLTYCTQGRSGTHFSFLEYRIVIERNREHSCLELKRSTKWKTFEHEQNAWGYWQPANAKPAIVWIGFQRKEISSRLLIPCRQVGIKLNKQILDQTHLEGKWLYCVDSVVVKCDLFQVLQPLEGLKIYSLRTI